MSRLLRPVVGTTRTLLALGAVLASSGHALAPTASVGMAVTFGDGIEYAPYEDEMEYSSFDPVVEAGVLFGGKHRATMQYMLLLATDELLFPDLTIVCHKLSVLYGYQILPGAYVGPHAFLKIGQNTFRPYEKIFPDYQGSLRDEYRLLGGGATLQLEPARHFAVQLYFDLAHTLEHERTNGIREFPDESDPAESSGLTFPSGKHSNLNLGLIFLANF